MESQESSSEEIEEAIETDEEPCENKGGRQSFFESWTKFSSSNENEQGASKNS